MIVFLRVHVYFPRLCSITYLIPLTKSIFNSMNSVCMCASVCMICVSSKCVFSCHIFWIHYEMQCKHSFPAPPKLAGRNKINTGTNFHLKFCFLLCCYLKFHHRTHSLKSCKQKKKQTYSYTYAHKKTAHKFQHKQLI